MTCKDVNIHIHAALLRRLTRELHGHQARVGRVFRRESDPTMKNRSIPLLRLLLPPTELFSLLSWSYPASYFEHPKSFFFPRHFGMRPGKTSLHAPPFWPTLLMNTTTTAQYAAAAPRISGLFARVNTLNTTEIISVKIRRTPMVTALAEALPCSN